MSKAKKEIEPQFTRGQTALLNAMLLGGAVFVGWASDRLGAKQAYFDKAEAAYIVKYECVIADMDGRMPTKYRCDLPEKHYIGSGDLHHEALAEADKAKSTKQSK